MRRSICYSETTVALAGEKKTWRFIYTAGAALPKGSVLRFDIGCKGRSIDWQIPTTDYKAGSNVIWAELWNGKKLNCEAVDVKDSVVPQYECTLPQELQQGKEIVFYIGTPHADKEKTHGNSAQLTLQRRRPFYLFIDAAGKGVWSEPEIFTLDIKGNELYSIKILAPSQVVKNKRFDVVLRFEDIHGNLTNNAPENTLVEITHENLRDNLKWKLFLPETGYIAIPNLYFNEIGVYTIKLKNVQTGDEYFSSPIKCFTTDVPSIFWGLTHGESERFDSTENIENCLRHFRDEKSLNFYGTSSPDDTEETPNDIWKSVSQNVQEFNEDDRFTTFLGQQWVGAPQKEGLRIFLYGKDEKPILRSSDTRSNTLKKIYKLFAPKEMLSIPLFTMSNMYGFSFEDWSPEFERVCEIYNAWGSSECSTKDGNRYPIASKSKKGCSEWKEGALIGALRENKRIGFVAGGLDDRSIYASLFDIDQQQYNPGLTAIIATQHSRPALFEALYNRHCYATTGERIIVGFSLAGSIMGSEVSTQEKPGLHINRHIEGYVAGTAPLEKVEIIRNGDVIHSVPVQSSSVDFEFDDLSSLTNISIPDPLSKALFSFYYLRIVQQDGHMAWSSPIWIDCHGEMKSKKKGQATIVEPLEKAEEKLPAKKEKPVKKKAK
ncbi:MAG: DUF3604 domain-containing protein [Chlamydia sp.]